MVGGRRIGVLQANQIFLPATRPQLVATIPLELRNALPSPIYYLNEAELKSMAINTESQFGTELAEIPYTLHKLEIEIIVMLDSIGWNLNGCPASVQDSLISIS